MSETDVSFWIMTTFGGIITTVLSWIITAGLWMFMSDEGRFFFRRNFDKKGIDVLRHEPLSNRLRLITVKWNGQYFQHGKELIFFGIETLINPNTDHKKYFNEVIGKMCTWAGSKRPVLFATDVTSHLITPDLLALIARSRKHKDYVTSKTNEETRVGKIKAALKEKLNLNEAGNGDAENEEPTVVSYLETMKPDMISEFMEDIGPRDAWQIYETGKRVNELERANGFELSPAMKFGLTVGGILLIGIVIYLAATGQLESMINQVRT